ncbi:hypothetical protein CTM97_21575 [Photobacterium phosphoreum]|uniref:Chitin-binding type-3 domain-containing protein n=1 Tax=Photobacterium phosphoreum TaxID=659 RepID=A0A2T3JA34_PHOPO|nr:lytic polysaccharide monooxygenase [Photobacterium phosphoreum]PSU18342.1 hypothetical protein CTM96_21650 [Photobacterium phosphoreum]PSU35447.1 hypothetical protein CTM97_21575 [Photobacterium phosphoreum]PSU45709.1 hypothetical protein C9J18_21535 [Photobacterium phosphoreum]
MPLKLKKLSLAIALIATNLAAAGAVSAHGWADFPPSRTEICDRDGGYWQDKIPNAACQALWDKSNAHPFTQKNENAKLTADYNNIEAVKKEVVNGLLCSGGDEKKAGLDIPHNEWQKTEVVLDANGEFDFKWVATATHNPSFWQFYITKPGYDKSQPLTWDDLDLVDEVGNVEPTEATPYDTYNFKVKLPKDRVGEDVILYSRWQRIDPAGEGFYNCSDITIKQGNGDITPPPVVGGDLHAIPGFFVKPGFAPKVGNTVRFRLMAPGTGAEVLDERLVITSANQATWAQTLAEQVNALAADKLFIGVWNQTAAKYEFNANNIHANQVWVEAEKYGFALSIFTALEPLPPVVDPEIDPELPPVVDPELPEGSWSKSATYVAGDMVMHNDKNWKAGWWTKGEQPGVANVWTQVLAEGETPAVSAWSAAKTYNENDVAIHDGISWKAHWHTVGEEPGTTGEWGVWRKL